MGRYDGGDGGEPHLFAVAVVESHSSSDESHSLYRLDGDEWTFIFNAYDVPYGFIHSLTVFNGELYIGGRFRQPAASKNLVRLTPRGIQPGAQHAEGLPGHINHMAVFGDSLYASGKFPIPTSAICCVTLHSHLLQRWDGNLWTPLITVPSSSADAIGPLAAFDDGTGPNLYVGGTFATLSDVPGTSRIAKWNGQNWSAVEGGVSSDGNAAVNVLWVHDEGTGPALYVGGTFSSAGGIAASNIAKWNGTSWSPLGPGLNGAVLALATFDDGTGPALHAGGLFTHAGELIVNHIAKWDGRSWSSVGGGLGSSTTEGVGSLAVFDDGLGSGPNLFAGGNFTIAAGSPVSLLAQWDGRTWASVGDAPVGDGPAFGSCGAPRLSVIDEGSGPALYATSVFGTCRPARWNGIAWAALANADRFHNGTLIQFKDAIYSGGHYPALARWGPGGAALGIAEQPQEVSAEILDEAILWVNVNHGGAASFQWHRNGIPLNDSDTFSGATTDRLVIYDAVGAHEGTYEVVISNDCTSFTSRAIALDVLGTCGADASGNGSVDVEDLLAVINNWGATGSHPTDVTGNGIVNQQDLQMIIWLWGPCP